MILRRRLRALEALAILTGVTVLRRRVAMHRWAPRLVGRPQPAVSTEETPAETMTTFADERVRRAVLTASRRSPVAFSCLDEAVAGAVMLRRRGFRPSVVIGLPASDARAESHAWLLGSCGAVVIGGRTRDEYVPVTVFSGIGGR